MSFRAQPWSAPHVYDASKDTLDVLKSWDCRKKGIYVIRNSFDDRTLYVGKAADGRSSIYSRLTKHFNPSNSASAQKRGNAGIKDLVKNKESFTVRWAEAKDPGLAEGIAIAKLAPQFNKQVQWADIKQADEITKLSEVGRLGLFDPERSEAVPESARAELNRVNILTDHYIPLEQDYSKEYATQVSQDNIQILRDKLPEVAPEVEQSTLDTSSIERS